jgi:multidrug efflux pump
LKSEKNEKHGRLYMASEKFFDWVLSLYRGSLHWVLDHSTLTLVILFITIALNVLLIFKIPKGLFPGTEDTGTIPGRSSRAARRVVPVDGQLHPADWQRGQERSGGRQCDCLYRRRWGHQYRQSIYVALEPLAERKVSAAQIIDRLRPKLNHLPVASAFLQAVQDLRIGGRSGNAMYQYTLQSDNVQDLTKWAPIILTRCSTCPVCRT